MFLRVKTDYRVSANSTERHRSYYNYGMVLCEIIKANSNYNGHDPFNGDACDVSVIADDPDITERGLPAEPAEPRKATTKKKAATKPPVSKTKAVKAPAKSKKVKATNKIMAPVDDPTNLIVPIPTEVTVLANLPNKPM